MYASQRSNKSPSIFVAAKAATAIPVAHELVRDALIQAALDPADLLRFARSALGATGADVAAWTNDT